LRCLARLEVEYEDGEKLIVATDGSWKVSRSAITSNTLYHGEEYDARLEQVGWTLPEFNDAQWQMASVIDTFSRQINGRNDPPVRVTDKLVPVSITKVGNNSWVFDFGQNMVGLAHLKVQGTPGQQIVMRFAELLHPDGRVAQENLRSARATNVYICKGEGIEEWHPWFTYHGFRYVQIDGLTSAPDKEMLTGLVLNSDLPFTGEFSASADILNRVQKNIQWGQRGNLVSVPTDCPQRDERLGWMGDVQVFAPTSIFNMDMMAFYRKWMRDIRDGQHPDGWVTDVNPAIVVGGPSKPAWGDAVVIVPWMLYKYYGDKQVLEENYVAMKAWVDYMQGLSKNDIYEWGDEDWGGYGDWVAVDPSPTKPTGSLYYFYSSYLLSKIASVLGNSKDQQYYEDLSGRIAKAYHAKYFDPATGQYEGATQFANLMPLAFGITPAEDRDRVLQSLVANINSRGNHLSTGFLGTAYLLPVLTDNGFVDLAYELATKTSYPSWGYMVEQGATTIWELWNSDKEKPEGMNSRNHFAYGSVGEWYFRYLAGINPVAEKPGFQKVRIQPVFPAALEQAQASYLSGYGTVSSAWQRVGNGLQLDITIPANSTAQLVLNPGVDSFSLTESGVALFEAGQFKQNSHIRLVRQEQGLLELELASGSYQFLVVNQ
jgi:alpha-L-rhamnosidase